MAAITLLGTLSTAANSLLPLVVDKGTEYAKEVLASTNPLSRVGDLIVWKSDKGQEVIAALDSLGDQQARIESVVTGIESTQLTMAGTLGVVQTVSFATLGITSLSAGCMMWRFNVLNKRLKKIQGKLDAIETQVEAQNIAHLKNSLQFLSDFEREDKSNDLNRALDEARTATNTYGEIIKAEAGGSAVRLSVLNYMGRCYLLSLLTQLECLILDEKQASARERIKEEKRQLNNLAETMFQATIAKAPESYLDPALRSDGVTLDLMAEVYVQSQHAGAIDEATVQDANDMFEIVRDGIFRKRRGVSWVWRPVGSAKRRLLGNLRYLLACVEDTNRVHALNLLLNETEKRESTVRDLISQLRVWREEREKEAGTSAGQILAYGFV